MLSLTEGTGLTTVLGIIMPGLAAEEPAKPTECGTPGCTSTPQDHEVVKLGEAGWSNTEYRCKKCKKNFYWLTY